MIGQYSPESSWKQHWGTKDSKNFKMHTCRLDNTKSGLVSLRSRTKYLEIQDWMKLQSYFCLFYFFLTDSSSISGTDPFKSAWQQSFDLMNNCCLWGMKPLSLLLKAPGMRLTDVQLNIIYSPDIPIFLIWNYSLNGVIHKKLIHVS